MSFQVLPSHEDIVNYVVSRYGGKDSGLANALDVGRFNIPKWRKRGIPFKHHYKIVSDLSEVTSGMLCGKESLPSSDLN